MIRKTIQFFFISILVTLGMVNIVWAHPGHLADTGSGHSHWLALAIIVFFAFLGIVAFIFRFMKNRRRVKSEKTLGH